MSISYSQLHQEKIDCPRCSYKYMVEQYIVIDTWANPELVALARTGKYNEFECPACGLRGLHILPVLFFQRFHTPALIYTPVKDASEDQSKHQLLILMKMLVQTMGDEFKKEWIDSMHWGSLDRIAASLPDPPPFVIPDEPPFLSSMSKEMVQTCLLTDLYKSVRNPEMLEAVRMGWQQLIESSMFPSLEPELKIHLLTEAGTVYLFSYQTFGGTEFADQSEACFSKSLDLAGPGTPSAASSANNLATIYRLHAGKANQRELLDKAIHFAREAVRVTPPDSTLWPSHWANLRESLADWYERMEIVDDPDRLIGLWQRVIQGLPLGSIERAWGIGSLGDGHLRRYQVAGNDPLDLKWAAALTRRAVYLSPEGSPERAIELNRFGISLVHLYERTLDLSYIDQAIEMFQVALNQASDNDRPLVLNGISGALLRRYSNTGNNEDLNKALKIISRAKELVEPGSRNWSAVATAWAQCLYDRYPRDGNLLDLEQSLQIQKQSFGGFHDQPYEHTLDLLNLAYGWLAHYERTRVIGDLKEAYEACVTVLKMESPGPTHRSRALNIIGLVYWKRYLRFGQPEDLEQAVHAYEEAINIPEAGILQVRAAIGNLAGALHARYGQTHLPDDLNRAIDTYRAAAEKVRSGSQQSLETLYNLSSGLFDRYEMVNSQEDLVEMVTILQKICECNPISYPDIVLKASLRWGGLEAQRMEWQAAVQAYIYGQQAVELLLSQHVTRASKSIWLREAQSIYRQAAFAFAKNNLLSEAVTCMETGRSRLLSEALERYRADLQLLAQRGYPILAERYSALTQRLSFLERKELQFNDWPQDFDPIEEQRTVREELNNIIAEIQEIPEYEDFFRIPTSEKIYQTLTADGKAGVYILVTDMGGLALVVCADGVKHMWLNIATQDVDKWLIQKDGVQVRSGYLPAQMGNAPLIAELNQLLPILGEKVMFPIAELLKTLGVEDVTLIPCDRLGLLPLHAAEYLVCGQLKRFMDEFTVTYIPSARVLASCRTALTAVSIQPPALCGIGNPLPLPEDAKPLSFARPELESIAVLFGDRAALLYEQQATREALNAYLGQRSYLHFSCHGIYDVKDPLQSGIFLSNGEMLVVKDLLVGQRLYGTRLIVLSACQTAITDFSDLPEEAIGLPAGFVQAGVPAVVGTLWPVNDLSTSLLMEKFYEYHLRGDLDRNVMPMPPGSALRKAQLWLRNVTNEELAMLFDIYRKEYVNTQFSTIADGKFREYVLREPDDCPFRHPYFWAPFVFFGV